MKMFNLINIGERAGSGVPNIFNVWEDEGWVEPMIEEQFDPDRMILTLEFSKKQEKKASEKKAANKSGEKKAANKSGEKKVTKKTLENYMAILETMQPDVWYKASEFVDVVELKETRIKELLSELYEQGKIETTGNTKGKLYRKVDLE